MKLKPMIIVVALLVLILILYLYNRHSNIIEGLSNPSNTEFISKGLKNDIVSIEDGLHISKYQSNYQAILKDMMKWCDLEILTVLVSNKLDIQNGVDEQNTELITSLNQYSQFRNTLQSVYDNVLTNVQSS